MTARPRILLTRRWPEAVEQRAAARFEVTLNPDDRPLSEAELAAAMRTHDALCPTITDRVTAAVLGVPDRRAGIVASYGVGYEHIDLAAARAAGIRVTNTPGVLTDATADLALTLILMTARRSGEGERELRAGAWTGWRPTHLLGQSLKGKRLGLVGFGRIAQATAKRARFGFGMEIAYYARRPAPADIADRLGARFVPDLGDLLADADFVSLHVPGGAETRHMIDRAALARMRPDAILINTARGDVVDEAALIAALQERRIAGAGLDVFAGEPNVSPALRVLDNAVLLPHLGSATRETREAMGLRVLANLEAWFDGKPTPDTVA
ncbi:D-glycerate dehydrogenase [Sphingomonas sp. MMSM20]|uniref:2-hydroxyacid dehydrogenase n=1 Tax=Sphingomonas lycopersici TaxID=2951807 RepID=UPI002236F729|nr:D-glycerate dehydrogenase [Sphingomonas lycopersici]